MKSLLILFTIITLNTCTVEKAEELNKYTVTVDSNNLRKLHVEAELTLRNGLLSMDWISANSVEKGWAHFVENLKITDIDDSIISFEYKDKATWVLNTNKDKVKVSYDINLIHDRIDWVEGGHTASSYVLEDVVYSIGAAIFIANPVNEMVKGVGEKAIVYFKLPDDYKVAVPWMLLENQPGVFKVNSTFELVRSGLTYGNIEKSVFKVSNTHVEIATAQDFKNIIPLYKDIYEQIIPSLTSYFDGTKDDKYVVISNIAPRTDEFDPYFSGEGLFKSMSLISPIYPPEEYLPIFWYLLTHEYTHNWMGINIQPKDQYSEYWFMEGFTDYISWGMIHQLNIIPDELMISGFDVDGQPLGWGENIKKYVNVAGKIDMRSAGKEKQENYGLLYSGGSVFAMVLDIEMNSVSDGRVGIMSLMRNLNQEFGMGSTKTLSFSDIKNSVNLLTDKNLDYLFDEYVAGNKIIPINTYLNKAGIIVENLGEENQLISIDKNASAEQMKIFYAITGIE